MAGIKRKSPVEATVVADAKTKKVKKSSSELAVREAKPEKKSKKVKEEKVEKTDKKKKSEKTDKKEKKKRAPEPEPEEVDEDMVESDTSEAENGFYGFSASGDGAELPVDEDEDMDDDDGGVMLDDKASKKNGYQANANEKAREKKGDAVNPQTSRESHIKQKEVARERKAAKPNADSIQRAKKLWERLRIKSAVEPEERKRLVSELFDIMTGRVKDFVFKHDSVRPVQCALKYASPQQRLAIAKELKGDFKSLAESKYAKFLIAKLLVEGDDEVKSLVITDFYGNVRRLINHPEAAWILDDAYRGAATPSQKAMLLREWYGPDFALFRSQQQDGSSTLSTTANLSEILAATPEKRKPIMDYLSKLINQLIQKKLTGFTILHDAMIQYYQNLVPTSSEFTEFFELLKSDEEADLLKNLAFTKSGSHIICHLLAYSDAKSRRQILKAYKDTMEALAFDKHGHQILLTAFEVIDDTKMTAKAIFPELFGDGTNTTDANEKVLNMSTNLTARIPLLALLSPSFASKLYTPTYATLLPEIHSIRTATSKKDPTVRRKELIGYLAPYITTAIQHRAFDFSSITFGCQFVAEALLSISGPSIETLSAVADLAKGDPTTTDHVAQSAATGRMLASLVRGGRFNQKTKQVDLVDPPLGFENLLYERISEHLVEWATGPSSFVVVALVENSEFTHTDDVLKVLQKNKKKLEKAATTETAEQKAFKEQKAQVVNGDENAPKGNKKRKVKMAEVKVGNAGSRTLLEKL